MSSPSPSSMSYAAPWEGVRKSKTQVEMDADADALWIQETMAMQSKAEPMRARAQSAGVTRPSNSSGGGGVMRRRPPVSSNSVPSAAAAAASGSDSFGYKDNLKTHGVGINVPAPMSSKAKYSLSRTEWTYRKKMSSLQRDTQ
jgi:hypothetical protein